MAFRIGGARRTPEASLPGLVLALLVVVSFYVAAGVVSPDLRAGLQPTVGVSLNAGVIIALSLLPSRRQFPVFLLVVGLLALVIWRPTTPGTLALAGAVALANVLSVAVFRFLAFRYAAGELRLDSHRYLLSLAACGVTAVAVNAVTGAVLVGLIEGAHWLSAAVAPSAGFLLGTRPAAQADGIATIAPLILMLMHRRPGGWPRRTWVELACWSVLMIGVGAVAVEEPRVGPTAPLLLLVTFSGLAYAVLRSGGLAAAVLTPAFAVSAALVMSAGPPVIVASGVAMSPLLLSQLAAFLAAVLAWTVATVVAEREAVRELAHSRAAAQEAVTTLQRALLPAEVISSPDVRLAARYRAAGTHDRIGGDWYDAIALPAGGTALVIGDVEGHDLTAASVMGLVRGAVRSYALEGHPPSIVLERVGAFLVSAGTERLVTMAYVQLYPDDTAATVAVAGHPVPFAVRTGGTACRLDVQAGPLLGLDGLHGWRERTVRLPRDACLVLYTDGLTDFPAAAADQTDRLIALAADAGVGHAELLADTLISAAPRYDDAAVLVAQITASGVPEVQRTFPAQSISAGIARTWLADLFEVWQAAGLLSDGPAVDDQLDKARLLLTELVANAVRHGDRSFTVRLHLAAGRLRVEVADNSDRMPVLRRPEAAATEGRGLRLVDALAGDWGVQLEEHGKVVWFELALRGDADEEVVSHERLLAAFAEPDGL